MRTEGIHPYWISWRESALDILFIDEPRAFAQRAPTTSIQNFALNFTALLVGTYRSSLQGSNMEYVEAFKTDMTANSNQKCGSKNEIKTPTKSNDG